MNCPKCGSEVEPGTPICPDCSTIISANGGTGDCTLTYGVRIVEFY